jgi:membrane-bound lytic murein transglycosylase B
MRPAIFVNLFQHATRSRMMYAITALVCVAYLNLSVDAQAASKKPSAKSSKKSSYVTHPEAHVFMQEMQAQHGYSAATLQRVLSSAHRQSSVLQAIQPPSSPRQRSWQNYRAMFLTERHISQGLQFATQHATALTRAESEYGVPSEVILAILGVETAYGRNTGAYRVIDALATLAFDYPPRARFFRDELEQYLLLSREQNIDPRTLRGSFAGAIGIPQFMPSSYRRWGVDFDGDGKTRLLQSPIDAIGSVGNFLKIHGWVNGAPIAFTASAGTANVDALLAEGILPTRSLAELQVQGLALQLSADADQQQRGALIDLPTPDLPTEYRVGLQNFYAITRYNRSAFYAAAVMDLAHALRERRSR